MFLFDSGNRALFREDRKKHWASLRRRNCAYQHKPALEHAEPQRQSETGQSWERRSLEERRCVACLPCRDRRRDNVIGRKFDDRRAGALEVVAVVEVGHQYITGSDPAV